MKNSRFGRKQGGFTLIELAIVIVGLTVLYVVFFGGNKEQAVFDGAKELTYNMDVKHIHTAINTVYGMKAGYGTGDLLADEGVIDALPSNLVGLLNPWGQPYTTTAANSTFQIISDMPEVNAKRILASTYPNNATQTAGKLTITMGHAIGAETP